jgi:restriction system protein
VQALAAKEAERQKKEAERQAAAAEKERIRRHVAARTAEVEQLNGELGARNEELQKLLRRTLDVDDFVSFEVLKEDPEIPPFNPGDLGVPETAPQLALPTYFPPSPPSAFGKLIPGSRNKYAQRLREAEETHKAAVQKAEAAHERELSLHAEREASRQSDLAAAKAQYESESATRRKEIAEQHEQIQQLRRDFELDKPEAIVSYFSLVLQRSAYPDGFPRHSKMAFVPESKQLVVELELPESDVVPEAANYKYVKATDKITFTNRPITQRRSLYQSVVAQLALRTLHELFEADRDKKLDTIVFNGYVETIDKGTGQPIKPYLVTVRTTRDAFHALDLALVDPIACLKTLNASVSKSPAELVPVRPVVDFNMVDPRFVEEADVLSTLDQRPNLMELTPGEFEALITNLFERMGLETRMTQASRDGGVDCVAYDPRPIFGGKVVIQAKRYKNTVGVSAVRDLFGTMQNEGASKGILITTSGYGKASFEFAEGKPMELLSGSNLLYLLAEHTGMEAKIEPPDDWIDPVQDSEI